MSSVVDQVLALRKAGGYCRDESLGIIEVSGPHAAAFLQARLSNDVLALASGQGQLTCFLDRQAKILAALSLHRLDDAFWLLVAKQEAANVLHRLEEFRFREPVSFRALTGVELTCLYGAKSELVLATLGVDAGALAHEEHAIARFESGGKSSVVLRCARTGEPGLLFVGGDGEKLQAAAAALNMVPISEAACLAAYIEAGRLMSELSGLMMAETGLETTAASYTKGCFPGQEVLARIRTYGAPRQGLIGLIFDNQDAADGSTIQAPGRIALEGKEVGRIIAATYSPTLSKPVAIALIQREHRMPGRKLELTIEGAPYAVTTVTLPFVCHQDRADRATTLYQQALQEFAKGSEQQAATMLKEVIDLNPTYADAYESLGVILSRLDQLDEAIAIMKQLSVLDQESIMSHANLSVFYMQKGDKTAAEDEKALAMSIRMGQMARAVADEQAQRQRQAADKADASQRLSMFTQVLALDPDDFLANAGVGSVYVDLQQYDKAIEPLRKALATRPNHTVAYVALGKAYEELGKANEAKETYRKGIAVAAQRGDGEPLKKMQIRLDALTRANAGETAGATSREAAQ